MSNELERYMRFDIDQTFTCKACELMAQSAKANQKLCAEIRKFQSDWLTKQQLKYLDKGVPITAMRTNLLCDGTLEFKVLGMRVSALQITF